METKFTCHDADEFYRESIAHAKAAIKAMQWAEEHTQSCPACIAKLSLWWRFKLWLRNKRRGAAAAL